MGAAYYHLSLAKGKTAEWTAPVGIKKIQINRDAGLNLGYGSTYVYFYALKGVNTIPYMSGYPTKIRVPSATEYLDIGILDTGTPCKKLNIPLAWITETNLSSSDEEPDDTDIHEVSE